MRRMAEYKEAEISRQNTKEAEESERLRKEEEERMARELQNMEGDYPDDGRGMPPFGPFMGPGPGSNGQNRNGQEYDPYRFGDQSGRYSDPNGRFDDATGPYVYRPPVTPTPKPKQLRPETPKTEPVPPAAEAKPEQEQPQRMDPPQPEQDPAEAKEPENPDANA